MQAMPQGGVAFYNCGQHSGRSQPHKHLQVTRGGGEAGGEEAGGVVSPETRERERRGGGDGEKGRGKLMTR